MKILTVCGSGLGSSLLVEMNIKSILDANNVDYESVEHTNVSSFSPNGVDFVVVGADLETVIDFPKDKMIVLQNILSKEELEKKMREKIKF